MSDHHRPSRDQQRAARALSRERGLTYQQALQAIIGVSPHRARRLPCGLPVDPLVARDLIVRGKVLQLLGTAGCGKSTIAGTLVAALAQARRRVLMCSLERPGEQLAEWVAAQLRPGAVEPQVIDGNGDGPMTIDDLRARLVAAPFDAVLIDSVAMLAGDYGVVEPREGESRLLVEIADLARDLDVAVIVTRRLPKVARPGVPNPLSVSALSAPGCAIEFWVPSHEADLDGESRLALRGLFKMQPWIGGCRAGRGTLAFLDHAEHRVEVPLSLFAPDAAGQGSSEPRLWYIDESDYSPAS